MCGRYRLSRPENLAVCFDIEPEDDWVPRYNIAPAQNIPVIRQHPEKIVHQCWLGIG
jgi:putative SOS response-associated peptidase YedK